MGLGLAELSLPYHYCRFFPRRKSAAFCPARAKFHSVFFAARAPGRFVNNLLHQKTIAFVGENEFCPCPKAKSLRSGIGPAKTISHKVPPAHERTRDEPV
ncbi:MAG: hypothetical protein ABSH48_07430 [Verrucomicrobiota bacterium]|jgi:hypothetical protein